MLTKNVKNTRREALFSVWSCQINRAFIPPVKLTEVWITQESLQRLPMKRTFSELLHHLTVGEEMTDNVLERGKYSSKKGVKS